MQETLAQAGLSSVTPTAILASSVGLALVVIAVVYVISLSSVVAIAFGLLAGENVGHAFVVPTVASCVDIVVHLATESDGRRRVREIVALPGRAEGDIVEVADIFTTRQGRLVRADGYPPHRDRFERAGYDLIRLLGDATYRALDDVAV